MLITANKLLRSYHARQVRMWRRSNLAADQAEATVRNIWDRLKSLSRCRGPECYHEARELFTELVNKPLETVYRSLRATYRTGHAETVRRLKPRAKQAVSEALTPGQIQSLLVASPSADMIQQTIFSTDWMQRLLRWTSLGNPSQLAQSLASGLVLGLSQSELLRRLVPVVENVRQTARRVARMETLRVAHHAQMNAHESLGDLVIGYRIHATLDSRVRPKHAARSGKTWYKDSGVSMRVALDMDADDLPDDHNCRCFLVPVLRD